MLRGMPIETQEQAKAYRAAFTKMLRDYSTYGTYQAKPAGWKPLSVAHPDLFAKSRAAEELSGEAYWSMNYEDAIKLERFASLPYNKWLEERLKRGMGAVSLSKEK